MLLEAGADIEAGSDAWGDNWIVHTEKDRTPLIWAATGRNCLRMQERMCRFLLEKGADVNARNVFNRTAFQEAARSVRYNEYDPRLAMETLLAQGAYVNAHEKNIWTALTECGHYGRLDVAELLLTYGAQVDGRPGPDEPANESNPDLTGRPEETPLVVCAEWSWNEEMIVLLLDKGADLEGKNKEGKTMAELAIDAERGIVLEKLKEVGKMRRGE